MYACCWHSLLLLVPPRESTHLSDTWYLVDLRCFSLFLRLLNAFIFGFEKFLKSISESNSLLSRRSRVMVSLLRVRFGTLGVGIHVFVFVERCLLDWEVTQFTTYFWKEGGDLCIRRLVQLARFKCLSTDHGWLWLALAEIDWRTLQRNLCSFLWLHGFGNCHQLNSVLFAQLLFFAGIQGDVLFMFIALGIADRPVRSSNVTVSLRRIHYITLLVSGD